MPWKMLIMKPEMQSKDQMDTNLECSLILLKLNETLAGGKELNKYVTVFIV